ncbi:MAG: hypothetical protein K9N49_02980 [Candidatus Marinimicrobia bacterium]|nr:hypothetical protein [Candidatus Neomarinimicrobiota bacterium]
MKGAGALRPLPDALARWQAALGVQLAQLAAVWPPAIVARVQQELARSGAEWAPLRAAAPLDPAWYQSAHGHLLAASLLLGCLPPRVPWTPQQQAEGELGARLEAAWRRSERREAGRDADWHWARLLIEQAREPSLFPPGPGLLEPAHYAWRHQALHEAETLMEVDA